MNANTIASIGNLYPTNHVFNVANLSATALGTTAIGFSFTGSNTVAICAVPTGGIVGSVTGFDPETNPAIGNAFGSQLLGRSRSGRPYFNANSFNNRPFFVRAVYSCGLTANGSTATTVQFGLYVGTSSTLGSNTQIANTGTAVSIAATKTSGLNAVVEAELQWDSVSQALTGLYNSWIGGSVDTSTTATIHQVVAPAGILGGAPVTGITSAAGLAFQCGCTIGTTAASSGSVGLVELSIEQM